MFSIHAQERMHVLAIDPDIVQNIIENPEHFRFGRNATVNFIGRHGERRIRVVLDPWDDVVLTVSYIDTIGRGL
jgi:hypothetical protein